MSATVRYLSALLVFQLLISAYLHFGKENIGEFKAEDSLLTQSLKDVDTIALSESDKEPFVLKKEGEAWIIPSAFDHPASKLKIENIIKDLNTLNKPYPAGNTLLAAKNFQTAKDDFKHKLVLSSGDKEEARLFFGKSPGFKKVYVRVADTEKTYAVAFPNHNLQTEPKFWLDKDYSSLDRSLIKAISLKDISLDVTDTTIQMSDLPEGKTLDDKKASQLLSNTTQIRFSELLGTKDDEAYNLTKPHLIYTVTKNDGTEITYTIGKMKDGEKDESYVLKRSDQPYYYKILKFQVEKASSLTAQDLLKEEPDENKTVDNDSSAPTEELSAEE